MVKPLTEDRGIVIFALSMSATPNVFERPGIMPLSGRRYTYEQLVAELPETNQPCELWDGELVMSPTPSFYHQEVAFRMCRWLYDWVTVRKLGKVITAPIDMVLSAHRATQPDVAFIAQARLHIIERVIMGPVDLAVEIISSGSRNRDRIEKRDLYEQHGIKEYWIVDPESETVDALFLENFRYVLVISSEPGEIAASRLLPGFQVAVNQLFHGE